MTNSNTDDLLRHADWLGGLARALTGSDADADDAVQEALTRATTSGARPNGPARPWLAGILRNVIGGSARSRVASDRRERAAARPEARRSASDEVALLERQRILLGHVEALPLAQRRTVIARYFDGRPPRAIAREENIATAAVHSRLRRALATLRERLDAEFGDRETWAGWIAPVAALGAEAPRSLTVKIAAAALVLFAGVGAGALALDSNGAAGSGDIDEAAARRRSAPDAELLGQGSALETPTADPAAPRRGAAGGSHTIAVVRADDGEPVTGVDVVLLRQPSEALVRELMENPDTEELIRRAGAAFPVDERGEATFDASPPAGVLVRAVGLFGAAEITEPSGRVVVEVAATGGFLVSVVDREGDAVERAVRLRYELLVGDRTDPNGMDSFRYELQRLAEGGTSLLQMPLGVATDPSGDGPLPQTLEWITIATPGAAEYTDGAARSIGLPFGETDETIPIALTVPEEVGAVELTILDSSGDALGGEVGASMSFPDAAKPIELEYPGGVTDGRASWPEVVACGERMEIRVMHASTGQSWEVVARAPSDDGEVVRLETRAPASDVISARLVDGDGAPHANDHATLAFAPTEEAAYAVSVSGRTDDDGRVRFAITDDVRGRRASGVRVAKRSFFSLEEGFALLDRAPGDLDRGGDLGTITVETRPRARIEGTVKGPDGAPLSEVHISMSMAAAGHTRGAVTASDGTFSIEGVFGDVETLEAVENRGRFAPHEMQLRPYDLEGPLEIRLGTNATMVARLDARGCPRAADMIGGIESEHDTLRVALWPTDGGSWCEAELRPADEGRAVEVLFPDVQPGTYAARIGLRGRSAIVEVPGVVVPTGGGTYRVAGLDGLRLADVARYVEVVGTSGGDPIDVQTRIFDPGGAEILSSTSSAVLIPVGTPHRAVFTASGLRAITMDAGVPRDRERIELVFDPGYGATVTLLDPSQSQAPFTTFSFELETGPAAGSWTHGGVIEPGEPVALIFAERGRHRLHLQRPAEQVRGGWTITALERTDLVIDVTKDDEAFTLELTDD